MAIDDKQIRLDLKYVIFRPHPITKIFDFLIVNIFIVIMFIIVWGIMALLNIEFPEVDRMLLIFVNSMFFLIFEFALLILAIISWVNTYYLITPDTIAYNTGLLSNNRQVFVLRNVIEIDLHQDLTGKIFNYGTIKLEAHLLEETVFIRDIIDPKRQITILNNIARSTQSQLPISASPQRGGIDRNPPQ